MKLIKKFKSAVSLDARQRGLALITVLSTLSILVVLTVATLSLSSSERRSSVKYADGEESSNLADMAVSMVMGSIWDGTRQDTTAPGNEIWASQPGAIQKFNSNGALINAYKLYSDDQMVTAQGVEVANDGPPNDWNSRQEIWTDLNDPVVRPDSPSDRDNDVEVIFPIIDPRAYIEGLAGQNNSPNIEGFTYQATLPGVRAAESVTDINARLAMPVRWLYVLKDGNVGHLSDAGQFVGGVAGTLASEANPIVGRIAYWTDDETCKININTAGEPTPWAPPTVYHTRDYEWAIFPPTRYEFQRYPGHPATVAMSSVLFPNRDLSLYAKQGVQLDAAMKTKERIYEIMPKINKGGSIGGTVPFWALEDPEYQGQRQFRADVAESVKERLYASVDELLFSEKVNGNLRLTHDSVPDASMPLFNGVTNEERALERVRFFLTAKSRAPETNMFGLPRVAIWPVADESLPNPNESRTVYDRLIAYCASYQGDSKGAPHSYIFRRADSTSSTFDYDEIKRNKDLLEYLYRMMGQQFPSGGGAAASFVDKYGSADSAQILAEIFDYVRSTNVYDGILAPSREEILTGAYRTQNITRPGETFTEAMLRKRDQLESQRRTYTAARASGNRAVTPDGQPVDNEQVPNTALPGHGQVVPIETRIAGGTQRGFGRFPTISEAGFQFICTADGNLDNDSWKIAQSDGSGGWQLPANPAGFAGDPTVYSGGRTAGRIDITPIPLTGGRTRLEESFKYHAEGPNQKRVWFSNYPPFPPAGAYGTDATRPETDPRHPRNHPGFYPENWNATLQRGNPPLVPGQRRIQAALNLELTVVGTAFTGIYPDFVLEIEGMDRFRIGRQPLFNALSGKKIHWRPQSNLFNANGTGAREPGGSIGPSTIMSGRGAPGIGDLPADTNYNDAVQSGPAINYKGDGNFDFVSSFFTVTGDTINFSGGTLRINVYATRTASQKNLVQQFTFNFPASTLPVPELVTTSSPYIQWKTIQGEERNQYPSEAPRWWAFHNGGALRRWIAAGDSDINTTTRGDYWTSGDAPRFSPGTSLGDRRTRGRFHTRASNGGGNAQIPLSSEVIYGGGNPSSQPWRMPGQAGAPARPTAFVTPNLQGPFGHDSVVSLVPRHGDIRHIAAKKIVPETEWVLHPDANLRPTEAQPAQGYMAHSMMTFADPESGANQGSTRNLNNQLVAGARYDGGRFIDLPDTTQSRNGNAGPNAAVAKQYGDFDTGLATLRDGAWINRADEGNTGVDNVAANLESSGTIRRPTAYFDENWRSSPAGESYMTPNRMMPSPVVFGSLPTAVNGNQPWRTLLFRPFVQPPNGSRTHPGAPNYGGGRSEFSGVNPADHYLLDLFWMPVVEPYAISEPFSTAGKVNINYQMVPFNKYITRSTGMHAVLKGEILTTPSTFDVRNIHSEPGESRNVIAQAAYGRYYQKAKWSDDPQKISDQYYNPGNNPRLKFWHRNIDVDIKSSGRGNAQVTNATLGQFNDRFEYSQNVPAGAQGIFRTASQICEVHLVPKKVEGAQPAKEVNAGSTPSPTDGSDENAGTPYDWKEMKRFWDPRAITGENLRERPYANIYAKITTRSNTFKVHFRAQSIRKARSAPPNQFVAGVDTVASDYRGSALIERRIDPNNPRLPDYATNAGAPTLDQFYSFRVLERKRFTP